MTVGALTPEISYVENGVTLIFAVPFRYLSASALAVSRVVDGVETALAEGADWSATAGPTDAGGALTLTATVAGATLRILRDTSRAQQTDYASGDSFPAESHEKELDRLAMVDQEQDATLADIKMRALLVPIGELAPPVDSLDLADGMVLGIANGRVVPVANDPAAAADGAAAAQAAKSAAQIAAASATDQAAIATAQAGLASTAASAAGVAEANAEAAASLAMTYGGTKGWESWPALAASPAPTAGTLALVFTDTGTHTDPVVGGTVSNSGLFSYSTAPAGYKRIGSTQAALAAASAALANGWARALGEDGTYSEAFLDNTALTTINLTDGAAITYTPTNNATNLQIAQATAARTVLYSTLNLAPVEQRITLRCNVTAAASAGNGAGICFYNSAGDFTAFYYQANGWFRQHSEAGLSNLSLTLDAWAGATVIDYVVDLFADGTARLSVTLNGGKTWHFGGLTSVPLGAIKLVVCDTMTVQFSMTQAAVPAFVSAEINNGILPAATPYEGLLKASKINPPPGLDPAITAEISCHRLDAARAFSNLSLGSRLSIYDPRVSVIYVDVAAGNDVNPGTAALPIKRLSTALNRAVGGKVKILAKGGTYQGLSSFNQTVITAIDQLEVVSSDGAKVISSSHETIAWTLDTGTTYFGTFTNVFYSAFDAATVDANGDYLRLTDAGTLAACRVTVGSYYKTGTTIYVNLGRVVDANVRIYTGVGGGGTGNFYYKKAGGSVYLENVELHGGYYGAYVLADIAAPLTYFRHRGCAFKYALTNGMVTQGRILAIGQESIAAWNTEDGFVYHYYSTPLGIPLGIEVNCIGRSNGWNSTGTNNGSTTHDGGQMVRVNCSYSNNQNRQIHDVNGSLSWMVGCTVSAPRAGAICNYSFGLVGFTASIAYLDGCSSLGTWDLETLGVGSTIYRSGFTSDGANVAGANIVSYVP